MSRRAVALCLGLPVAMAVCGRPPDPVQLVITGADVLDARTVLGGRTIVADDGRFLDVLPGSAGRPDAVRTIEAHGRLVVPGLVDAHSHLATRAGWPMATSSG